MCGCRSTSGYEHLMPREKMKRMTQPNAQAVMRAFHLTMVFIASFCEGNNLIRAPGMNLRSASLRRNGSTKAKSKKGVFRDELTMSQSTFPHVAFPIVVTGGVASVVSAGMLFLCAEPVRRAVYFWVNAGPIVAHYKFTKWWLGTRTTTREHRDAVYGRLHNRYCQPALNVVLNLKGKIASSRSHDFFLTDPVLL